jgi:Rieske Fe-S protein
MKKPFNRRHFLRNVFLGVLSLELGYLFFDVFKSKADPDNDSALFPAGKINSFEKNSFHSFQSGKFCLSILEDGGMIAISAKCTHLGCLVEQSTEGFQCPCHASAFNKYGEVLSPPATRALDIFPIVIRHGEIFVDTKTAIKRKAFNKSQLTYS